MKGAWRLTTWRGPPSSRPSEMRSAPPWRRAPRASGPAPIRVATPPRQRTCVWPAPLAPPPDGLCRGAARACVAAARRLSGSCAGRCGNAAEQPPPLWRAAYCRAAPEGRAPAAERRERWEPDIHRRGHAGGPHRMRWRSAGRLGGLSRSGFQRLSAPPAVADTQRCHTPGGCAVVARARRPASSPPHRLRVRLVTTPSAVGVEGPRARARAHARASAAVSGFVRGRAPRRCLQARFAQRGDVSGCALFMTAILSLAQETGRMGCTTVIACELVAGAEALLLCPGICRTHCRSLVFRHVLRVWLSPQQG